jgi:hypothetical protein
MKVDEFSVLLSGRHSLESECTSEISSSCSFRTILGKVADAAEASIVPAATTTGRGDAGDRIRQLFEQLIAEIIALISGQKLPQSVNVGDVLSGSDLPQSSAGREPPAQREPAWVTEFSWENVRTETIREHERSDFSASGVIHTADGRSIDFRLGLAMRRDFECTRKAVDSGTVRLCDPLVINFDGQAAELADTRFSFDLDSDGKDELIHGLAGGSAFLALDRNSDGRINDGSELFGARSGNGFADLAQFDGDGNHWLDDADPAFASLKAWSRDADGRDSLSSLKDKGVGAIYLGAAETPFAIKDGDNQLRGQLRASGVYLHEDGRAGSLQQIDLAV